jgi:transglutaminase-like putative cysteine protease
MDLDIGCSFRFDVRTPTHVVLLVEPHTSEYGRVRSSELAVSQLGVDVATEVYVDAHGNRCRRATFAVGPAEVTFAARMDVSPQPDEVATEATLAPPAELPAEVLTYLLPSRFCESDLLADQAWTLFGGVPAGWQRICAITDWVHDRLDFGYGTSSPTLSADQAMHQGAGVCRDFAHLAIGLCRGLNIPARYVFGYLPDIGVADPGTPMDFCAWTEVFVGGRWHTFDPRNNERRIGRVVIGRGRDAADVAMVTSFGELILVDMSVIAERPAASDTDAYAVAPPSTTRT